MIELSSEVMMRGITVQQLFQLHEAALAISGELDLTRLLQRIVDAARDVTAARYGALGIVGDDGAIELFITSGISEAEREWIGSPPRGHGLLGVLINDGCSLRIDDISADPRRSGFPPRHPHMTSLLGMPVVYRGQVIGDLYMADKATGEPWSDEDAQLAALLANHAAVAIANARLYQALERERNEAEAERQQLQVLLESLPDAVMVCDAAGTITMRNAGAQRIMGWEPGQSVAQRAVTVCLPDGTPCPPDDLPIIRTLRDGVRVMAEYVLVKGADSTPPRDILASTAPLHDGRGRLAGGVGVYQDITALRDVERLKEDFFAMATHELRTPLTSITMAAGLLADLLEGQGGRVAALTTLLTDNAQRMRSLVNDLLDLTRLEHGRLVLHRSRVDIRSIARRVLDQMEPLAERKMQTLRRALPARPCYLHADATRIEQVLLNLLTNAIKYTPAGGSLCLYVEPGPAQVRVCVQDNGPGVPKDEQESIFDRFYRSRRHESDGQGGTGLGLPIARMLVELHGGQLGYEPAPRGGSRFCFTLPAGH